MRADVAGDRSCATTTSGGSDHRRDGYKKLFLRQGRGDPARRGEKSLHYAVTAVRSLFGVAASDAQNVRSWG